MTVNANDTRRGECFLAFLWLTDTLSTCAGFFPGARTTKLSPFVLKSSSSSSTITAAHKEELRALIDASIASDENPERLISEFEKIPSAASPNRSREFLGEWHVWYTNCPPPSNGQLGPFQGTSEQLISGSSTKSYKNLLKVPPNDWLTATLDGVWEEWDGTLLVGNKTQQQKQDFGEDHWKVTFLKLQIAVLGHPLFIKEFPGNTSRIWRTSYMDDDIRIVHAGQTGLKEDEYVFYTKRTPKP